VRHTIIRLIGAHLRLGTAASWQGLSPSSLIGQSIQMPKELVIVVRSA
jgi:hypothetical protein